MSSPEAAGQSSLQSTPSFARMASEPPSSAVVEQATGDQKDAASQPLVSPPADREGQENGPDVFDRQGSADSGAGEEEADDGFVLSRSVQDPSEELPIEIISLTDRSVYMCRDYLLHAIKC